MYLNYNKFIYNRQQHACSSFDDITDRTVWAVSERKKSQPMRQTNVRRNDITSARKISIKIVDIFSEISTSSE